jgi:predicted lipoprotein with Yx(FWY)xxD motif
MSEVKPIYKMLSAVFIVLTAVLATSTGYFIAYPNTMAQTVTQSETEILSSTMVTSVSSPLYPVNIAYKPGIGFYLTNSTGWTLYILTTDIPSNGTSTCTGQCVKFWPVFYVETEDLTLPAGLNATSFGEITRADGAKQTTYNGWPLYYIKDTKSGDTNGQGVNKVWFVYSLPQPSVLISTTTSTTSTEPGGGTGGGTGY